MTITMQAARKRKVRPRTGVASGISVRSAVDADASEVIALVSGVLAEFGLPFDLKSKDSDLIDIEGNYSDRGGAFDILEDGVGRILGTCGLYRIDHETIELRKMYFVPEIRGLGIGWLILSRAVDRARDMGYRTMVLETTTVLEQAIRLYQRFGFVRIGTTHLSERVDQTYSLDL